MNQSFSLTGFGVSLCEDKVLLLCKKHSVKTKTFHATVSADGIQFYYYDDTGIIIREDTGFENVHTGDNYAISRTGDTYVLIYTRYEKGIGQICSALSNDGIHWYSNGVSPALSSGGIVIPDYYHEGNVVLYGGTGRIYGAYSKNLGLWERHNETLYRSKLERIKMGCVQVYGDKIHLFYFAQSKKGNGLQYIKLLRFDRNNPFHRLDAVPIPVWKQAGDLEKKTINPIGLILKDTTLLSYWHTDEGNIITVSHVLGDEPEKEIHKKTSFSIQKHHQNPILEPISSHIWESQAVFNAAAVYENGKVHLVYRAVGNSGVSMFGYANSKDGIHIDERSKHPIFIPSQSFEGVSHQSLETSLPSKFVSGPSWGGVEDPRLAKVGDKYYLTYVAFDGWSQPRLAMSSIANENFLSQNWQWSTPVLISRPNEVNKSGAILPESINGKYYIFHRVFPNLLIDVVDSLDEFDGTKFLENRYKIGPRADYWDSRKLGIGATPIKTKEGWLVIYHGVDDKDDSRYKIGAMMLDLHDPTKVLARTPMPIIEPTEHYENSLLKYGVVYPCGAVIKDDDLIVYYGGSDAVLCAATAPANSFIDQLMNHDRPILDAKPFYQVTHA